MRPEPGYVDENGLLLGEDGTKHNTKAPLIKDGAMTPDREVVYLECLMLEEKKFFKQDYDAKRLDELQKEIMTWDLFPPTDDEETND